MKKILFGLVVCLALGCSDNSEKKVDDIINETSDSLAAKVDRVGDTLSKVKDNIKRSIPKVEIDVVKTIPISLQWISFEEQGSAKLIKKANGTYTINGEQTNNKNEFLKIDGKIKRLDANKISFDGTVITYVKDNNGGKPCEKTGTQVFMKKDGRNYYRLQNMTNCAGGNLVDYVDIYDLDKIIE